MRVVLDTNVLVTALLHGRASRHVYESFLRGELIPVFSRDTLAELIDVLTRPTLRTLTSEAEIAHLLDALRQDGLLVHPARRIDVCRDPKDNIILECAIAGAADCIITGDADLLCLHPFERIDILRPVAFLRRLT